jgi:carbamoyltransferase
MIVLGITETHCATAAILRDGVIVGCASEERFTRLKNDAGYPRLAVDALLKDAGLTARDIDVVALAGTQAYAREWMNRVLHDIEYAREYYGVRLEPPARGLGRRVRKLGARVGVTDSARGKVELTESERLAYVTGHLGIGRERIVAYDHHACHAAAAYFGSHFGGAPALILTNDNSGDGLCATASSGQGSVLTRREATPSAPGSLGAFYSFVTLLLGMKFGEHEYKVMGLAPYAPARLADAAAASLRELFELEPSTPARFAWKRRGSRYRLLLEATLGQRFDAIAAGAQRIVEETLLRWARLMRERHGGDRLALGGGVFMNVKANGLLAEEDWLRDLFVFPSCGDESNAVGAAYLGYVARERRGRHPQARPHGEVSRERARADRGPHRRSPGLGRRRGPLRRANGVRRPGSRQSLHPRQSLGPPGRHLDQQDDQEPRLLDAVRAEHPPRARGRLRRQPQGLRLSVHDAGLRDQSEAA